MPEAMSAASFDTVAEALSAIREHGGRPTLRLPEQS
jgi:hypothetical protein